MAPRESSGRHRRPWWKAEGKTILFVPGYWIRHLNPDFSTIETYSPVPRPGVPYIPKDEIWIDERFEGEKEFLLKVYWYERRCPETGEKATRNWLNRRLAMRQGPPTKDELKAVTVKKYWQDHLLIRHVRGEKVRHWWDVWFVFGGHDLVYPEYIPENEVWVDVRQDPREVKYTLHHELHERANMARGIRYPAAHRLATESEQKLRSSEVPVKRKKNRLQQLPVEDFHQVDGHSCGTTSLKCVCWYHGRRLSKKALNEICGLTGEGIDHEPLAVGATRTGAHAFAKSEGSLSDLRYFLEQGYPVIVGWWSYDKEEAEMGYGHFDPAWTLEERIEGDCGHYSVVYHMSDEYIWLMDPQTFTAGGEIVQGGGRRMRISHFLDHWYDTDGPRYDKVERWYLVVNYDGRTFADRFTGGRDHSPDDL